MCCLLQEMPATCYRKLSGTSVRRPIAFIKSRSTASTQLSAYAHWLQTHRHLSLVITLVALCCTWQGRTPNIDRCAPKFDLDPDLDPWPLTSTLTQSNSEVKTRFLVFDLDLWPMTLAYNPNLAKVKVNLHTKFQGRRSNGSAEKAQTDIQTDVRMLPSTLSPSLRGR